jgi:hypothetical protein
VLCALFLFAIVAMGVTGWKAHNAVLIEHGGAPLGLLGYLRSGAFASAVFENWESEFLQMAAYVILTAFLFQRGSAESRDPDGKEDAPNTSPLPLRELPPRLFSGHCAGRPLRRVFRPAPLGEPPGGSDGSGPAWDAAALADRPSR